MEIALLTLTVVLVWSLSKIAVFMMDYIQKLNTFRDVPNPPVKFYPFLGHAMLLRGNPDETYEFLTRLLFNRDDFYAEIAMGWVGTIPVITVLGPNSAEALLHSSQHMQKSFFYTFLHSWLGTGLLTSDGEKWKSRRRLLTPTFHFSILGDFLVVMNEQANIFSSKLQKYAKSGETFNICQLITLCVLDIICETAMGQSTYAQDNEDSEYVKAIYRASFFIQERQKSPWLWPNIIFDRTKHGKEYAKCLSVLHEFTRRVVNERKESFQSSPSQNKPKRLAFLDMLFSIPENGNVLSVDDIQEEVDTFMFEGHDTTAAALGWALHLIGSHPDVQRKIHAEIDGVFGDRESLNITQDDLRKLQYLEMAAKESLRIFPSVPIIGRVTTANCVMDGHHIPEGTNCILFTQAINKHPNFWTDPERFDPERFSPENSAGRHPFAYVPFSAGPRNCIGQKFAMMEEKVVLIHLLRKYSVEACDKTEDLRLMGDIVLRSRNGINVKLTERELVK